MKYLPGLMVIGLLAAPAGGAQSVGSDEQELISLENAWAAAIVRRDDDFLRQLYADEYLTTSWDGSVADKETDMPRSPPASCDWNRSRSTT